MKHEKFGRGRAAWLAALAAAVCTGCAVVSAIPSATYTQSVTVHDPNLAAVAASTYTGEYTIVTPPGVFAMYRHVKVSVTIDASHKYSAIVITDPSELASKSDYTALLSRIIAAQSLQVDGVSGASYSSTAVRKAVEAAF
jgi:uncharacterized protein with FMN-binding domain